MTHRALATQHHRAIRAIRALEAGATIIEAAGAAGVRESSLRRIMKRGGAFAERLNLARKTGLAGPPALSVLCPVCRAARVDLADVAGLASPPVVPDPGELPGGELDEPETDAERMARIIRDAPA